MTIPIFRITKRDYSVVTPRRHASTIGLLARKYPIRYILCYSPSMFSALRSALGRRYLVRLGLSRFESVVKVGPIGLIAINGIGAPHSVFLMERLIALGAREFIIVGSAGGLVTPGVYLCNKAVRDEGTSYHYLPASTYAYASMELSMRVASALTVNKVKFQVGPSWTTDAPYREMRSAVVYHRSRGVRTVDMEAAALYAVARMRQVKAVAIFEVRDLVLGQWHPGIQLQTSPESRAKIAKAVVSALKRTPRRRLHPRL